MNDEEATATAATTTITPAALTEPSVTASTPPAEISEQAPKPSKNSPETPAEDATALAAQLKGAIDDRKLLRRHCKRLEAELTSAKQKCEISEAALSAHKAKIADRERALDSAKTRYKQKEDELLAQCRAAESAREAVECELRLAKSKALAAASDVEAARAAAAAAREDASAREAALEAGHKDTLRSAQMVIAALKEEVSKSRTAVAEAESQCVAERARAEAAVREASSRELSESSTTARLRAQMCELEARHAEDIRQRDARLRALEATSDAAIDQAVRTAKAQAQQAERNHLSRHMLQREADMVAELARLALDAQAAASAAFDAAANRALGAAAPVPAAATDAQPQQPPTTEPARKLAPPRRFSPPASQRHKWRTLKHRATFGDGPLGLNVSADRDRGLRVTRVRGQALAAGAAAGDRVKALNGVALPRDATELEFADAVATAQRPMVVDLERDVRIDDAKPDALGWTIDQSEHPCPSFGIYSPVVMHLLQQWTSDANKLQYVKLWLGVAANADSKSRTAPSTFPRGLQLASLKRELLDAFLTMVVPILRRARGSANVVVKTRPCGPSGDETKGNDQGDDDDQTRWDLALRVELPEPPPSTPSRSTSTNSRSAPASILRASPFKSAPPVDDEQIRANRDKLAAQRRKAVEEKLAKMRDLHR